MFKLTSCLWTQADQIKRVEGFPQTLCIRITLMDDTHYERWVSEEKIADYADPNGKWQQSMRKNYESVFGGSFFDTPEFREKMRREHPYTPPPTKTREEAMDYEVAEVIREIERSK